MAYIGNSPENIQRGKRFIYEFKATAGQTAFSGADLNNQTLDLLEENEMGVYLNGVRLADSDDYNVSGDTLTLISAASLNDQLTVETQAEIANISSYTRSETDARYINYDGDIINGTLQIAGSGNNIELGDSNKVIFGAGSDLQIYHTGTNSQIIDAGSGDLYIGADSQLGFLNAALTEWKIKADTDGAVKLYYDNSQRLATISTGVDVTGTLTADGLTVDGTEGSINFGTGSGITVDTGTVGANPRLYFDHDNLTGGLYFIEADRGNQAMEFATSSRNRMGIASNGDISFYEDTGTTAKFYWDASEERLGIGTSSPTANLNVVGAAADPGISIKSGGNGGVDPFKVTWSGGAEGDMFIVDDNGNVGIGTAAPNTRLTVGDGSGTEVLTILAGTTGESQLRFADGTSGSAAYQGRVEYEHTNNILRLGAGGGTDVAIDASGNMDLTRDGANLKLYYNNAGQYSANLGWRHLQLGNNGANYLVAGNTSTGGDLYFVVNNTTDLSTNNGSAHNGTVAMHIDSSGNVLVGKSVTTFNTAGSRVSQTDGAHITRSGGASLNLNRLSSNGDILGFYKDGGTVGNLGVADGDNIYIASDDTNDVGLKFNGDGNRITPCNALGADRGSAIDLGEASSGLFKDLYLSGGIQFDARSNKLDDYEEGNWTPSIKVENAGAAGITVNHASYTKIGRLVSLVFQVTINSVTGTNSSRAIQLEGMPFTINTASGGGPNIGYTNLTNSMSGNLALQGRLNNRYRIVNLTGATGENASDHIQATTVLRGQFTYHTDQ